MDFQHSFYVPCSYVEAAIYLEEGFNGDTQLVRSLEEAKRLAKLNCENCNLELSWGRVIIVEATSEAEALAVTPRNMEIIPL
ncbi:hypothetical protein AB6E94_18940 [Vibrio lentus]|uniref:hypothetical protein n=1 Tax=Vibrio splendidus TaxID=29497 RepID=UPI000C840D21|nr:hypothetical protein [Vibrio splendidus]PMG17780.1 hypothetical protein BCU98_00155 [Vibrio splendidus]